MRKINDIRESLRNVPSLADFVTKENNVDEGLKDVLSWLKNKFKQVVEWLGGFIAKIGNSSYWLPVDTEGNPEPAVSFITASQAYVDGEINKSNTIVVGNAAARKATGNNAKPKDALKLYGPGNSIQYWEKLINESAEDDSNMINEVTLRNSDPEAKFNVLDIPELIDEINFAIKNNLSTKPMLILGAPGIGKTAIIESVIDSLPDAKEWNFIAKTLSNETPENFTLPSYVEKWFNNEYQEKRATDIPKTWLPVYKMTGDPAKDAELDKACGKGLLFIDELSRTREDVLNVLLPIIQERRFAGEFKIGSGWVVISASNRIGDDDAQTDLNTTLLNRFEVFYFEPTVKSWRKWAETQNYMQPILLDWLSMPESEVGGGGKYFYYDPNEEKSNGQVDPSAVMCTPRSWTDAMRRLARFDWTGKREGWTIFEVPENILGRALNPHIPYSVVRAFMDFLDLIRTMGGGNPKVAADAVWNSGKLKLSGNKKDIERAILPFLQMIMNYHADKLPTTEEFNNLCKWVVSTGKFQCANFMLDIFKNIFINPYVSKTMISNPRLAETTYNTIFASPTWQNDPESSWDYDESVRAHKMQEWSKFFSKWGLKDENDIPHYIEGIQILSNAFGSIAQEGEPGGRLSIGGENPFN